jgi:hypothetical protein
VGHRVNPQHTGLLTPVDEALLEEGVLLGNGNNADDHQHSLPSSSATAAAAG